MSECNHVLLRPKTHLGPFACVKCGHVPPPTLEGQGQYWRLADKEGPYLQKDERAPPESAI